MSTEALFAITFLVTVVLAIISYKKKWKIIDYF